MRFVVFPKQKRGICKKGGAFVKGLAWRKAKFENADAARMQSAQTLGLISLVLALFLPPIGFLCGCIGLCKLNMPLNQQDKSARNSVCLVNGCGILLGGFLTAVFIFVNRLYNFLYFPVTFPYLF